MPSSSLFEFDVEIGVEVEVEVGIGVGNFKSVNLPFDLLI